MSEFKLKLMEEQAGGFFVDVIDVQLALGIDERNMAGTGLVLPADDIASGRIRRVPPPVPPLSPRTRNQTELEHFKSWRPAKISACFGSWND
eukprot:15470329-Alexandrium_andersonii.AAC.1